MQSVEENPRPYREVILETTRRGSGPPIAVFVAHVAAYTFAPRWRMLPAVDVTMHLAGGCACAWFIHVLIEAAETRRCIPILDSITRPVLLFALVSTAAVFWEFAEYCDAYLRGTHEEMGVRGTLKDIFVSMIGGAIFAGTTMRNTRSNSGHPTRSTARGSDSRLIERTSDTPHQG